MDYKHLLQVFIICTTYTSNKHLQDEMMTSVGWEEGIIWHNYVICSVTKLIIFISELWIFCFLFTLNMLGLNIIIYRFFQFENFRVIWSWTRSGLSTIPSCLMMLSPKSFPILIFPILVSFMTVREIDRIQNIVAVVIGRNEDFCRSDKRNGCISDKGDSWGPTDINSLKILP